MARAEAGAGGAGCAGRDAGGEAGQSGTAWVLSILSPPLPPVNALLAPWTLPALTGCGFISHALKPRNNEYNVGLLLTKLASPWTARVW